MTVELCHIPALDCSFNEPLARHTSFGIGGSADIFVRAGDGEQMGSLIAWCDSRNLPLVVIGNGTNLLVNDAGVRGVVARFVGHSATWLKDGVVAEAGLSLPWLWQTAAELGLAGLEFASGIPGTVGGAAVMNAGAEGSCFADVVESVQVLDHSGNMVVLDKSQLEFGYRSSNLDEYLCVLNVSLRLERDNSKAVLERSSAVLREKKRKQPLSRRSAGCVFKNPPGLSAWQLVAESGFRGFQVGGASVSTKHANFIVNTHGATAADVLKLIDDIRDTVRRDTGVELELEIRILEEDGTIHN